jgi:hypothetical protein
MKQDDVREKIKKIIKQVILEAYDEGQVCYPANPNDIAIEDTDLNKIADAIIEYHSTSLLQKMEQVIGEDDNEKILIAPMFKTMAKIRNQLRAELREKLEKMKGNI